MLGQRARVPKLQLPEVCICTRIYTCPPRRYVRTSAFDAYAPSVAGRPSYKLAGGAAGGAAGGSQSVACRQRGSRCARPSQPAPPAAQCGHSPSGVG